MVSDEDLASFLSGGNGVTGLDIARELVAIRGELAALHQEHAALAAHNAAHQATAECAMAECAEAKARLSALCEGLANTCASLREYLGAK